MKTQNYSGVVVKCNNQILLCKRNSSGSFPGMWSIPAGKVEEGETTQEAAYREFFEETAIDIDDQEIRFIGIIPRHSRDGKKIKGFLYVYLLEVDEHIEPDFNVAIDGHEHVDWGYFTMNEIKPETSGEYLFKMAEIVLGKKI